jgi:hypothetical protein
MQAATLALKDIHTSQAIGWWPPAPGWWLMAALIPVMIFLLFRLYKHLTRKTAIKTAKKLLTELKQDLSIDHSKKLCALSTLIRRTAISVTPRENAASLTGQAWLAFLDASVAGSPFSEGVGRYLADAPYRQSLPEDLDISQLISLCETWLNALSKQR